MHPPPTLRRAAGLPLAAGLARFGARPALVTPEREISYAELADLVDERASWLGATRRLVMLTGANDVETVVTYLAALSAGHPVLLVPGDNPRHVASLVETYDPDVVVVSDSDGDWRFDVRRPGTRHRLHPDLALLMSTSGSTGSPKLVRLSADNLQSNAEAIASYLGIRDTDRAVTTLPLHYCYGLSVLNSHLLSGAGVVLTDLSVVDACFWDLVRDHGATSLAGVPYTFELLERVGFTQMRLPGLRYLTQAGGPMPPERVQRFAELGQRSGWDLFVMYGQTEATARMAYLPPDLAQVRPEAIGVPVPGGSFRLEPYGDDADRGELVYSGANVMLGYAEAAADLALGRTIVELRTGDVARRGPDGLLEIVGRRSRFVKILGLRVDLDQVERLLADEGVTAACIESEERLVVAAAGVSAAGGAAVVDRVRRLTGLPVWAVEVAALRTLPRLANGKPDYAAVAALAPSDEGCKRATPAEPPDRPDAVRLCSLYAELLGRDDVIDTDSFVSLEGDSLSYVEVSIRLEEELGELPTEWHTKSIARLVADSGRTDEDRIRRCRQVETSVLLRAVAIVMIVGSHANLFTLAGGAHVLLGVAGFNLGRFHLTSAARRERLRHLVTSVLRVAVPSMLWIGAATAATGDYPLASVLLLNGVLGPDQWSEPEWYFWFIEAVVWSLVALAAVLATPVLDRLERRRPFWFALGFVGLGLLPRYEVLGLSASGDPVHAGLVVFWLFALGWAAAKALTRLHRGLVTLVTLVAVPGFFGDAERDAIVVAGLLLLVWVPGLRVPRQMVPVLGVLAASSLYIYLTHWQVYPHLEDRVPLLALLASLTVGVGFARIAGRLMAKVEALVRLRVHDDDPGGERTALHRRGRRRHRDVVPTGGP